MDSSNRLAFTVPINGKMIKTAEKLSKQQRNQQKAHEVYFNTLAVLAVDFYCQCLEIETELEKSFGLDSVMSSLMNTTRLFIKGKGLLECRPVLPEDEFCHVPVEVSLDSIGYIVVKVDEPSKHAKILGFVQSVQNEQLVLSALRPLKEFLIYLQQIEETPDVIRAAVAQISDSFVDLSKWFEGLFDSGWELEVVKDISPVNIREKQEVSGAKIVRLLHVSEPMILVLRQIILSQNEAEILLRLYPASESIFLPYGVKMTLLDSEENPIPQLEKQAKANNWLQLQFKGNIGDKFSLRLTLGEDNVTERFII